MNKKRVNTKSKKISFETIINMFKKLPIKSAISSVYRKISLKKGVLGIVKKLKINPATFKTVKPILKKILIKAKDLTLAGLGNMLHLTRLLRQTKVMVRLIVSFLLLSIIPLAVLGILSYSLSSKTIQDKIKLSSSQLIEQTQKNLYSEMEKYKSYSLELSNTKEIQQKLEAANGKDEFEKFQAIKDLRSIMTVKLSSVEEVSFARFILGNEVMDYKLVSEIDKELSEKFMKLADEAEGTPVWTLVKFQGHSDMVCVRAVNSINSNKKMGYLYLGIKNETFLNTYKNINLGDGSELFVIDNEGQVISSSRLEEIGTIYPDKDLVDEINSKTIKNKPENKESEKNSYLFDLGDQMISYSKIKGTDWNLVGKVPYKYIMAEPGRIRTYLIGFIIGCIILAVVLSLMISLSISQPLNRILGMISKAKNGNLTVSIKDDGRDEIAYVIRGYNEMLENIGNLVGQVNSSAKNVLKNSVQVDTSAQQTHVSSKQISEVIQQVAIGAADQADDVCKCANNIGDLAKGINKVEENMNLVSDVIQDTRQLSKDALEIVKALSERAQKTSSASSQVIENITGLSDDIKQIKKIVEAITAIADQTGLLSLNASIEAARAGEAGKGFSVVASEVKKLAVRAKESTVNISNIIDSIMKKTEETVRVSNNANEIVSMQMQVVEETNNSFLAIFKSMGNISQRMNEVSESLKDVMESKDKTMEAIESISAISQETSSIAQEVSATTEEQAASSEELSFFSNELSEMARQLTLSVSKFKVD